MSKATSAVPEIGYVGRNTSYNFVGAIARSLLSFAYAIVLAKILTVGELGLFFLGVNIVTLFTIVSIGGLDVGLRRFVAISDSGGDVRAVWEYVFTALAVSVGLCTVIGIGLYASADLLAKTVFSKEQLGSVIRGLSPYILLYALSELLLSVTQGFRHMKYWVLCLDIVNTALRIAFVFALSLLGLTLSAAVLGYVLAISVAAVMAGYFFFRVVPARGGGGIRLRVKEMAKFSFPVAIARLVNSGNGILETMLIGYFLVSSEVGIYSVALKLAAMGGIVLASFNTMFAPIISKLHHEGKTSELRTLFSCVTRWTFSISLPIFALLAWFSVPAAALFGKDYIAGASCIVVLCIGQIVNAVTGPSGNMLLMSGYTYINLWTNLGGLVLSLLFNILLIPVYGIVGSALAVGVAITIINVVRVVLAWKILGMHPYEAAYWKPVVAASLMLLVLSVVGPSHSTAIGFVSLMFAGLLGALLYGILLVLFGLNDSDRYVFSKIKARFVSVRA